MEGLVLQKTPFQERHLICHLLGRNGQKFSVLFYGGRGGGPKKKASVLDLGAMLKMELHYGRRTHHLHKAQEWSLLWRHKNIRTSHKAFSLMCFYLEMTAKMAPEDNLFEQGKGEGGHTGLFTVLGNALFLLEKTCRKENHNIFFSLLLFLSKLLIAEGLFPEIHRCIITGERINSGEQCYLLNDYGGFAKVHALNKKDLSPHGLEIHGRLRIFLIKTARTKYLDMVEEVSIDRPCFDLLLDYGLYQFHFEKNNLKSLDHLWP